MQLRAWILYASLSTAPMTGWGFADCDTMFESTEALAQQLTVEAVRRAPVKYHEHARNIVVLAREVPGHIVPFATQQQGTDLIVVPPDFVPVMCKIALSTFLKLDGRQAAHYEAASAAAGQCLDQGGSLPQCLHAYAEDLAAGYESEYARLSDDVRRTALNIARSTLNQIVMHEYAHHFLNHFSRIQTGALARIDAEFEADLFCVLNGVQAAEPPSATYYFFAGVESIERHSARTHTPDYESAQCRAGNVDNITGVFGIAPMVLLDASYGGGFTLRRNSADVVHRVAQQALPAQPRAATGACSRIGAVALPDAYQELRLLYARIDQDADVLLDDREQFDTARALALMEDVSRMSEDFRYMRGVAAKSTALVLRRWGLDGRDLSPLLAKMETRLDPAHLGDELLSEDYGRILQALGLAMLQERQDVAVDARLSRSHALLEQAVVYNPAQSEAWVNLAFIALKQGDCSRAAEYADWAADTASEEQHRQSSRQLAAAMRSFAEQPSVCLAQGQRFHPYPGL